MKKSLRSDNPQTRFCKPKLGTLALYMDESVGWALNVEKIVDMWLRDVRLQFVTDREIETWVMERRCDYASVFISNESPTDLHHVFKLKNFSTSDVARGRMGVQCVERVGARV